MLVICVIAFHINYFVFFFLHFVFICSLFGCFLQLVIWIGDERWSALSLSWWLTLPLKWVKHEWLLYPGISIRTHSESTFICWHLLMQWKWNSKRLKSVFWREQKCGLFNWIIYWKTAWKLRLQIFHLKIENETVCTLHKVCVSEFFFLLSINAGSIKANWKFMIKWLHIYLHQRIYSSFKTWILFAFDSLPTSKVMQRNLIYRN